MHTKWHNGEAGLLNGFENASDCYASLKSLGEIPSYVMRSLDRRNESEILLADAGEPNYRPPNVTIDEFSALLADLNDETSDTPLMFNEPTSSNVVEDSTPPPSMKDRYLRDCAPSFYHYLNQFIVNLRASHKAGHVNQNQCNDHELAEKIQFPNRVISIVDVDFAQQELDIAVAQQNEEQSRGYNAAKSLISGEDGRQLIMFLSGEGGTGKSKLVHDITKYTQIRYGKTEGYFGAVVKTAPTGGAAFNIRGHTWHSALCKKGFGKLNKKNPLDPKTILNLQKNLQGAKLFILDEVSLLSLEDLWEINRRLCHAKGVMDKPFGGMHVILAGDFYQMKCISGTPIVTPLSSIARNNVEAIEARVMFSKMMTHFVQLTHNVRAQLGSNKGLKSPLAVFASKARVGDVYGNGVLDIMNQRVVNNVEEAMTKAHPNAVWISATHKRIAEINRMFREKFVRDGKSVITRLVSRHSSTRAAVPRPDAATRNLLYGFAGSTANKSNDEAQMASFIDVCIGTRVRIITNLLTECGLFNGAMGTVWGYVYEGKGPQTADERVPSNFGVLEDNQRELPIVLVQMDGTEESFPYTCYNKVPRLVPICAIANTSRMTATGNKYARYQIPILPAHGRTGHSVQGYTAYDGVVDDVGSQFFAGEYVALSRATDIEKVFLLKPVQEKHFTCFPEYRKLVHEEYLRLVIEFDNISCELKPRSARKGGNKLK
jgi:hypothetical protein